MRFLVTISLFFIAPIIYPQTIPDENFDWKNGRPEGCTTILVGKSATFDGSVMCSHTDDSHRDKAWMDKIPSADHEKGSMMIVTVRTLNDTASMPAYTFQPIGEIPQVEHTYGYFNTGYPCMNEHQLAVGESTMGGRSELKSDKGLIDCYQLVHLMMQRCKTAREAIELTREILSKYGWNDYGECLTIADTKEVWMLEIFGPGKGNLGAVWAAQRVPDDEVSVNANASRIQKLDLRNPDYYRASDNVFDLAKEYGWWNPEESEFIFCYAYDPDGRNSLASRRREWRALSLLSPSSKLNPNSEIYPFSVKPDEKVTLEKMVSIFQDYYEGTDFDMRKNLTVVDDDGNTHISPMANPFMPYDMNKMLRINGGWGWLGERTIARWYTMYATITQSRDWLPDEVGGVVWFAWDNAATSVYVPLYSNITDVPESYKVPGRILGYTRDSAWWGFNRLSTIAAHRWGEMRYDIENVWKPIQSKLFANQNKIETEALEMLESNQREKAMKMLTDYSLKYGNLVHKKAWELGDFLWTKYDEKF